MASAPRSSLARAFRYGLLAGAIALAVSVIGMVETFEERHLISGVVSLGDVLLFAPTILMAYVHASDRRNRRPGRMLAEGALLGLASSLPLILLIVLATNLDLRQFFPAVSPTLLEILTFGRPAPIGIPLLIGVMGVCGLVGTGLALVSPESRKTILIGLGAVLLLGVLSEILVERTRRFLGNPTARLLFDGTAFRVPTAIAILLLAAGASLANSRLRGRRAKDTAGAGVPNRKARLAVAGLFGAFLLVLPLAFGTYLSEVANNVGLYVLMGLGLNIVVGFAGLLDLGYVAFFAIGAYTMGVLTSQGPLGVAGLSFWGALPFCVAAAAMFGFFLGIPVLRMRGDYLAIVTLGFGEIIRILALSDLLKPVIGGAQGVLQIPKPAIGPLEMIKPEYVYYVVLGGCLLAAFIAWRLSEARVGRQWMAMREDEDVAEAMGIRLVGVKLLAFVIGASFSGLAGAIFASKLTSIFPHSFSFLISINVLCVIIVGGMGSIPGVLVGSLVLVGLPELLREFKEYRMLVYGVTLIGMMLYKPEGFWPSATRKRELHAIQGETVVEPELTHSPLVEKSAG
jgi:branched-chain amino acid transport system permease protein